MIHVHYPSGNVQYFSIPEFNSALPHHLTPYRNAAIAAAAMTPNSAPAHSPALAVGTAPAVLVAVVAPLAITLLTTLN
jgi:hypothetical protein